MELKRFIDRMKELSNSEYNIETARSAVKEINEFLFTTYDGIGSLNVLNKEYPFFSDFHKYWDRNYKEIINAEIDISNCSLVANALHDIYLRTNGKAFNSVWDTCGLSDEAVCKIRLLTANQDFRGSRKFSDFAKIYKMDPSIFDINRIINNPDEFIMNLKIPNLSQTDKRANYAKNVALFVKNKNCEPIELIKVFNNDLGEFKRTLINFPGSGYGNKKADMFIRDMIVLGIWKDIIGFENIMVASDVNTIKVALRTGILKTSIPLVSSFIDYFGNQYGYIDDMSSKAWKKVWEIWKKEYPGECIQSPCLLDYVIYEIIGRNVCKESISVFKGIDCNHEFIWHSGKNKTCQECYKNGILNKKANVIKKIYPCNIDDASVVIDNIKVLSKLSDPPYNNCPFKSICDKNGHKNLNPPKAISIIGQTGWERAYTDKNNGGGGLMS